MNGVYECVCVCVCVYKTSEGSRMQKKKIGVGGSNGNFFKENNFFPEICLWFLNFYPSLLAIVIVI